MLLSGGEEEKLEVASVSIAPKIQPVMGTTLDMLKVALVMLEMFQVASRAPTSSSSCVRRLVKTRVLVWF